MTLHIVLYLVSTFLIHISNKIINFSIRNLAILKQYTDTFWFYNVIIIKTFYKGKPTKGYIEYNTIFPAGYKVGFLNQKCQSGANIANVDIVPINF